ncbi:hypothetical protein VTO42DRAFT_3521 [Malbranchea cinnamomea]
MVASVVPLIIDGQDVHTTTTFDITNPVTGNVLHQSSSASVQDATDAAASAQKAFRVWSKLKPAARRDYLLEAARIMESRREELIAYQQEETGAARPFIEVTTDLGIELLKDFAGRIKSIEGSVPTLMEDGRYGIVTKEPYGVILSIAPWNAPVILGIRAIAIPLAAGNTIVLKGSEVCPKTFWAIGDIFRQAGLPAGCVNVVYHRPSDAQAVTSALIAHPAIKKINFTGSTLVGSIIASLAAKHVKPVLLELGGKASCIILDDADMSKAAQGAIAGAFLHSGQICMSTERIVVQRSIADKFREALLEAAKQVVPVIAPTTHLAMPASVPKKKELLSDAVSKGATVLLGDANGTSSDGSILPTVLENVTPEMLLYSTESFGPIATLHVVETEEDAIALANDTEYGLTAAVYTEDLRRGLRVARSIESGAVHINGMTVHDESVLPHGGVKKSGYGRFAGSNGFEEFLHTKTITWVE